MTDSWLHKIRASCSACADWPRDIKNTSEQPGVFPHAGNAGSRDAERQQTRERHLHTQLLPMRGSALLQLRETRVFAKREEKTMTPERNFLVAVPRPIKSNQDPSPKMTRKPKPTQAPGAIPLAVSLAQHPLSSLSLNTSIYLTHPGLPARFGPCNPTWPPEQDVGLPLLPGRPPPWAFPSDHDGPLMCCSVNQHPLCALPQAASRTGMNGRGS